MSLLSTTKVFLFVNSGLTILNFSVSFLSISAVIQLLRLLIKGFAKMLAFCAWATVTADSYISQSLVFSAVSHRYVGDGTS